MLKLHQLFFRTFSLIFLFVLVVISVSTYFWSKNIYLDQIEKNLSQNIDSLSLNLNSFKNLDYIIKTFKAKTALRITIINERGEVIADSDRDIKKMGNHTNRFEIVQARKEAYGKKVRYSKTLKEELLYVVKKIVVDDEIYYLRLADYTKKIIENFTKLSFQIIAFISLFMIVAFMATYLISIRIRNETNAILGYLIELSNKNPTSNLSSDFSLEFYKITQLLNKVASKLAKRQKQKAKQTAKLKLANKQKDEIISALSHEFKNPIAVVTGYSETILNDKELPLAMKEKFLKKINSNGIKMSNLIDKLRLSLKLEEGKQKLIPTKHSLDKICSQVISDLEDKYPNRKITVIFEKDYEISIDETLFCMALENLLENAIKYSEDEVTISFDEKQISVKDKGIGIDEENLKKINQKFYRVSENNWNNSLGLGLFIVSSIVNLHNFRLEIKSEINKGSEFTIYY